ncbi:hypothetical protein GCM10027605_39410 [Micromonospora zhanjiangensis]
MSGAGHGPRVQGNPEPASGPTRSEKSASGSAQGRTLRTVTGPRMEPAGRTTVRPDQRLHQKEKTLTATVASDTQAAARARDVWKVYGTGEAQVVALRGSVPSSNAVGSPRSWARPAPASRP